MPAPDAAAPLPPLPPLPQVLPVFPLTGSLLLPGNWLPLNVFEPRYRNLVEDAMSERTAAAAGERREAEGSEENRRGRGRRGAGGHDGDDRDDGERSGRWIGMIQPRVPQQDNWPALELPPENPEIYTVGCAGSIERCEPQPDGRYLILLRGASRFRVRRELPRRRGYRRVAADYAEFVADRTEAAATIDPAPLLHALRGFGESRGLAFDLDVLAALPGVALLNGLAAALPFPPAEKQALLEASGPSERRQLLLDLMSMGIEPLDPEDYYAPPTVH
ncbi:MAG TPA: LON peptidase substrate-binding domain-containing protein [Thermoanaerobaculia bacterium]|jgi:Lon protease-like protein|nr:LON peptidase substrate-binding domain-containing protein [Thermoanaerobaculia bacterium]